MKSKEIIKKLADTYETLLFVSERHPSSLSRLKNLLMSEGISETSARRKIADLDTEDGCLVVDRTGRLQLNQELISKMFLELQGELKIPNYLEKEQLLKCESLERKVKQSERQKEEVEEYFTMEVERYKGVIRHLKEDAEKTKQKYEWDQRWDRDKYLEASRKLDVAEEKISRMKKSVWSYFKVCWEDFRQVCLEAKRREREEKKRRRLNKKLIKKFERERKQMKNQRVKGDDRNEQNRSELEQVFQG